MTKGVFFSGIEGNIRGSLFVLLEALPFAVFLRF
jgi:hypothetical protein